MNYKKLMSLYNRSKNIIDRTYTAMGKKQVIKPKVKSSLTTKLSYSEIPNK